MNNVIKRIMAITVGLCTSFSWVSALAHENATETFDNEVDIPVVDEKAENIYELSLVGAINMALEENPQLLAADAAIKSAELSLEMANKTQKEIDDVPSKYLPVRISDGLEVAYLKHGYYPFAAQIALDLEVVEKEQITYKIIYDVTEKYYNVKLMEKLVSIAEDSLKLAQDNADVVKKNYELGYVSLLEVKNVDNAVAQAKFSLEGYERNLALAKEGLKIALQLDGTDAEVRLTDDMVLPDLPENVDEAIDAAMETRYDVTALKKAFDLQNRLLDITNLYVDDHTALYNEAYSKYIAAKYNYENTQKLIKLGLKSEYANILSAKNDIMVAENNLNVKKVEYDSAVIKNEMGVITNMEVTAIMTELESCRVQLENAQMKYLLAVLKFNYNTYIGI